MERVIDSYVHNGKVGVLVEVEAESDFATRTDDFKWFIHDLTLQIAAHPKDERVGDLLNQTFIKDEGKLISEYLAEVSEKLKEKIKIIRFVAWDVRNVELVPNAAAAALASSIA